MYILGISAFYHDSAVCLIKDGEILFAAQEERFTRIKHDRNFPVQAIAQGSADATEILNSPTTHECITRRGYADTSLGRQTKAKIRQRTQVLY